MTFMDRDKALDNVCLPLLWKVLRSFEAPEKYVRQVAAVHNGSKCQVIVDGQLSPEFVVESGFLQGNVLSLLLFAVHIHFVMRETVRNKQVGIA